MRMHIPIVAVAIESKSAVAKKYALDIANALDTGHVKFTGTTDH